MSEEFESGFQLAFPGDSPGRHAKLAPPNGFTHTPSGRIVPLCPPSGAEASDTSGEEAIEVCAMTPSPPCTCSITPPPCDAREH
eukprot:8830946-Pyramimonas_sp.AAC.1